MSSEYFDSSDHQQVTASRARASAVNNFLDAIDTGFALLPASDDIKRGLINYGVDSGIADAYVVTLPETPTALTDGMEVVFKAAFINTGACTVNVDSLGVKSIKRHDGTDPVAGDIDADKITQLRYNSTSDTFELQGNIGVAAGAGTMSAQNANAVAITGGTVAGITGTAIIDITDTDADTKIQLEESADEDIIRLDSDGVEIASIRRENSVNRIYLNSADTGTKTNHGGAGVLQSWSADVSLTGGAGTVVAAAPLQAGGLYFGLTARIIEAVVGCTSMDIGVNGGDTDLFVDGMAVTLAATAGPADSSDPSLLPYVQITGTPALIFTAAGGAAVFTSGVVRVELYSLLLTPPTS